MARSLETDEKIDRYIHGAMNDQEKELFESEMNEDQSLKNEVMGLLKLKTLHSDSKDSWERKQEIKNLLSGLDFSSSNEDQAQSSAKKIIDENTFVELMRSIVADLLPEETIAFELSGRNLIHELYEEQSIAGSQLTGELNFMEKATPVIEFIPLIIATYKLIKSLEEMSNYTSKLKSIWARKLVLEGMSQNLSGLIADKYAAYF